MAKKKYITKKQPDLGWPQVISLEEQADFWGRVALTLNPDKCWLWLSTQSEKHYGTFYITGRSRYAHRLSWQMANGRVPKLHVLHSCDTPLCVNPNHLREGTQAENNKERDERGRQRAPVGEKCSFSKLTETQVLKIKERLKAGEVPVKIAKEYGVVHATIYYIRNGETWKHLE